MLSDFSQNRGVLSEISFAPEAKSRIVSQAAHIVFAFSPNLAAAERVFSILKAMFGDQQIQALADIIQTALMLRYNQRRVG